jgi:hypothetical protein
MKVVAEEGPLQLEEQLRSVNEYVVAVVPKQLICLWMWMLTCLPQWKPTMMMTRMKSFVLVLG